MCWTSLCATKHKSHGTQKTSLKIPKGQSESVYRRTANTMAKRKSTNIDIQKKHRKLNCE